MLVLGTEWHDGIWKHGLDSSWRCQRPLSRCDAIRHLLELIKKCTEKIPVDLVEISRNAACLPSSNLTHISQEGAYGNHCRPWALSPWSMVKSVGP